jgi:hypothetical protein
LSKNIYKVIILGMLTAILAVYTNCGKPTQLQFQSAAITEESLSAFQNTVYPISRSHCIACHTTTSPTHAAADPAEALLAIQNGNKIDWVTPSNSRMVLKLRNDNHNCWSNCSANADEMQAAIEQMKSMTGLGTVPGTGTSTGGSAGFITTSESRSIQAELDDVANPQKSNTVRLDLDSAMLTPPMAKTADVVNGTYLSVNQNKNTTLAVNDPTAGVAYFNFNIRVQAAYKVWMYVNAPSTNDNGFYVGFDNTTPTTFDPTVNGTDFGWMLVPNLNQTLTVGTHKLAVREKKDGTKVGAIIVTADPTFNGVNVGSFVGVTISYDLAPVVNAANVKLMIDVADYDAYSYKLLNPRIVTSTKNIMVKNMRILLNKSYNPQNSAYTTVDKTITPADASVSMFTTIINKDKGITVDKISFAFEKLAVMTAGTTTGTTTGGGGTGGNAAASFAAFQTNVYPISRQYCIGCHTTTFPEHASADPNLAYARVVNEPLADFVTPANSRLVVKLRANRHNCGTPANCDSIANMFEAGITVWQKNKP